MTLFNFLRRPIDTSEISKKLDQIIQEQKHLDSQIQKLNADEAALTAAVAANTKAMSDYIASQTAATAALQGEIDALKAANPALDLGPIETAIAQIGANTATLASATTAPPAGGPLA